MFSRCLVATANLLRTTKSRPNFISISVYNNYYRCAVNGGHLRQLATSSSDKQPENLEKVSFEEFQHLINDKNVIIIDVREPNELSEHGTLPRSINIPLGDVETALKHMPNDQFVSKYGYNKPSSKTPIVFSCMKGARAEKAQLLALKLGYRNVKNFVGGWTEWAKKSKK